MADENDGIVNFMGEQFRRLNARFDTLEKGLDERFGRLETRMDHLERRQTASMHFEQSVLGHLTGINESIDNLRAEMIGMDRRLKAVEAR